MSKRGKKKRAISPPPPPVLRLRRFRVVESGLAFDFTTPSPDSVIGITARGSLELEIRFDPPLEKIFGSSSTLSVTHLQSRRNDTRITVLPHTDHKRITENVYFEFVTHTVKFRDANSIELMYLILENNQMRGDTDVPVWLPKFNLSLGFFEHHFPGRYKGLPFFPSDNKEGGVDLSRVPQGSMILHKPSGGITSSRVPHLLGYYATEEEEKYESFTGWKAVSIRFGRQAEAKAILMYLKKHTGRIFHEIGFLSSEHAGILDGAQCDGLIEEDTAKTPIEFKASRFNCNFEGAYMAQCIWEMGCGFPYIDLIRYCERQAKNAETGLWEPKHECKEIRLYRDLQTEQKVIQMCQASQEAKRRSHSEFYRLVNTHPYVEMRKHLDSLAVQANHHAQDIPVDVSLLDSLQEYKESVMAVQDEDNVVIDPLLDRIEKRQALIFCAYQEQRMPVKEICEQIEDYSQFLRNS